MAAVQDPLLTPFSLPSFSSTFVPGESLPSPVPCAGVDAEQPLFEGVDADLLLVSQIGGLRAKSARAQATASQLSAAMAECRERQEFEHTRKRKAREQRLVALSRRLVPDCVGGCLQAWRAAASASTRRHQASAIALSEWRFAAERRRHRAAEEEIRKQEAIDRDLALSNLRSEHALDKHATVSAMHANHVREKLAAVSDVRAEHARETAAVAAQTREEHLRDKLAAVNGARADHSVAMEQKLAEFEQTMREQAAIARQREEQSASHFERLRRELKASHQTCVTSLRNRLLALRQDLRLLRCREAACGHCGLAVEDNPIFSIGPSLDTQEGLTLVFIAWRRVVAMRNSYTSVAIEPCSDAVAAARGGVGVSAWVEGPAEERRVRRRAAALADRVVQLFVLRGRRPAVVEGGDLRSCMLAWRTVIAGPVCQRLARSRLANAMESLLEAKAEVHRSVCGAAMLAFHAWRSALPGGLRAKVASLVARGVCVGIVGPLRLWRCGELIEARCCRTSIEETCLLRWHAIVVGEARARKGEATAVSALASEERSQLLRTVWTAWCLRTVVARCQRCVDAEAKASVEECQGMMERLEAKQIEHDALRRTFFRLQASTASLPSVGRRLGVALSQLALSSIFHAWSGVQVRSFGDRRVTTASLGWRRLLATERADWTDRDLRINIANVRRTVLKCWCLVASTAARGTRQAVLSVCAQRLEKGGCASAAYACWVCWRSGVSEMRCQAACAATIEQEKSHLCSAARGARDAQRRALRAAFAAALDSEAARRAAVAFLLWRAEAAGRRHAKAEAEKYEAASTRAGITKHMGRMLQVVQLELRPQRLLHVWHIWRHWHARQHMRQWRDKADEDLTSQKAEQEAKFGTAMEVLCASRHSLAEARVKEECHAQLRHALVGFYLHAREEVAARRMHIREQGVVGLFAAERDFLGLQRDRYVERKRVHSEGQEVRLAALYCLRGWRRELEVSKFERLASRRSMESMRWEGTLAWLWKRAEISAVHHVFCPAFVCLAAWRAQSKHSAFIKQKCALQGTHDQVVVKLGSALVKQVSNASRMTTWDAWYRYCFESAADRRARVLQARCDELDELLEGERRERQRLFDEVTGRQEDEASGLVEALQYEADALRQRHAAMRARSAELSRQLGAADVEASTAQRDQREHSQRTPPEPLVDNHGFGASITCNSLSRERHADGAEEIALSQPQHSVPASQRNNHCEPEIVLATGAFGDLAGQSKAGRAVSSFVRDDVACDSASPHAGPPSASDRHGEAVFADDAASSDPKSNQVSSERFVGGVGVIRDGGEEVLRLAERAADLDITQGFGNGVCSPAAALFDLQPPAWEEFDFSTPLYDSPLRSLDWQDHDRGPVDRRPSFGDELQSGITTFVAVPNAGNDIVTTKHRRRVSFELSVSEEIGMPISTPCDHNDSLVVADEVDSSLASSPRDRSTDDSEVYGGRGPVNMQAAVTAAASVASARVGCLDGYRSGGGDSKSAVRYVGSGRPEKSGGGCDSDSCGAVIANPAVDIFVSNTVGDCVPRSSSDDHAVRPANHQPVKSSLNALCEHQWPTNDSLRNCCMLAADGDAWDPLAGRSIIANSEASMGAGTCVATRVEAAVEAALLDSTRSVGLVPLKRPEIPEIVSSVPSFAALAPAEETHAVAPAAVIDDLAVSFGDVPFHDSPEQIKRAATSVPAVSVPIRTVPIPAPELVTGKGHSSQLTLSDSQDVHQGSCTSIGLGSGGQSPECTGRALPTHSTRVDEKLDRPAGGSFELAKPIRTSTRLGLAPMLPPPRTWGGGTAILDASFGTSVAVGSSAAGQPSALDCLPPPSGESPPGLPRRLSSGPYGLGSARGVSPRTPEVVGSGVIPRLVPPLPTTGSISTPSSALALPAPALLSPQPSPTWALPWHSGGSVMSPGEPSSSAAVPIVRPAPAPRIVPSLPASPLGTHDETPAVTSEGVNDALARLRSLTLEARTP
eukprot:TRINITY_DN75530_c0_g1_i1.p1 TRINITY_DN75530_c0_g1~~TRINITY_DN75530_c0_g1_i1.p1  ORF type:complete len:1983 (-),score=293.44 TRINITY_DN75530_c0_g1_i1:55-5970(-)